MVENIYLFLIDYVETLMMHPILKGIELGFYILLWQAIGTFVIFSLSTFTEPLRIKMNLDLDYFLVTLSCLTGCFTAIYFLSGEYDEKVNGRALRMISIFGIAFQFFIPISLILGLGIIVPIYSLLLNTFNFLVELIPVLAGFLVILFCIFFWAIVYFLSAIILGITGR